MRLSTWDYPSTPSPQFYFTGFTTVHPVPRLSFLKYYVHMHALMCICLYIIYLHTNGELTIHTILSIADFFYLRINIGVMFLLAETIAYFWWLHICCYMDFPHLIYSVPWWWIFRLLPVFVIIYNGYCCDFCFCFYYN